MLPHSPRPLKQLAGLTAASLGALASPPVQAAVPGIPEAGPDVRDAFPQAHFTFAQEGVLGTSLELVVEAAQPAEAIHCQQVIWGEIERLRQILSTYDPASEISRVRAGGAVVSAELAEVLSLYAQWGHRTGGALSAELGEVMQVWKNAAHSGILPSAAALQAARQAATALNVDALGKSYIVDRAVEVARRITPSGLLNIGGDIRVWGSSAWRIGVADPLQPAENAPLLAQFSLRNAAVATSGGYARHFILGGQKFSHLIDPRSLQPAAAHTSATVVAADCVTANALATASCVLDVLQASRLLVAESAGHLLMEAAGRIFRGGILAATDPAASPGLAIPPPPKPPAPPAPSATDTAAAIPAAAATTPASTDPWPKDFQTTINVALGVGSASRGTANAPVQGGRGAKRPYMAIWIEDAKLNLVRTLAILGNNPNYQHELTNWFKVSGNNASILRAVSRATRPAGQYQFVWDGLDDKGKPLPQGDYVVFVELNREHGTHVVATTKITCGGEPATAPLKATTESDVSTVVYGPKEKPPGPGATTAPETPPAPAAPVAAK